MRDAQKRKQHLDQVYGASSDGELEAAYDAWAEHYDADLRAFGYRGPVVAIGMVARHVPVDAAPVLDAGCGTGLIGEGLAILGYRELEGLDLSDGMIEVARRKGVYRAFHRMRLGGPLDLPSDHYALITACGVLTLGHAKPDALDELVRVTRPGGLMVFTIRVDAEPGIGFLDRQDEIERAGRWRPIDRTEPFQTMPAGEPEVEHRVFAYQVA